MLISKQIVERLDGSIGFKSSEGKGSTFWIDVPYNEESTPDQKGKTVSENSDTAEKDTTKEQNNNAVHTVLCIEDNPANMQLMEAVMARFNGAKLVTAPTAEIGLNIARNEPPDLILMDINLPGMNGIEALSHLKGDQRTSAIPVIAITAAAMPKEVKAGKQAGFVDYITKPINIPEFTKSIEDTLNKKNP